MIEVGVPVPTAAMSRTVPIARFEFVDGVRASDVVAVPLPMPSEASRVELLELMLRSAVVPVEIASDMVALPAVDLVIDALLGFSVSGAPTGAACALPSSGSG